MQGQKENFDKFIKRLFGVPRVRYAVVINDLGEKLAGGMKSGVQTTTPDEDERRLEVQSVLMLRMAQGYERFDGKLEYSMIKWGKISGYFFMLSDERVLILTLNKGYTTKTVDNIQKIVEKFVVKSSAGKK